MNVSIGKKIRSLRQAKNISQSDLAKMAGIAQSTLSYIENSKKSPQFDTLAAICRALDVNMLELLTYKEPDIDIRLFENGSSWQNILTQMQTGNNELTSFLSGELPPDALIEICAFERYLYNKYSQTESASIHQ